MAHVFLLEIKGLLLCPRRNAQDRRKRFSASMNAQELRRQQQQQRLPPLLLPPPLLALPPPHLRLQSAGKQVRTYSQDRIFMTSVSNHRLVTILRNSHRRSMSTIIIGLRIQQSEVKF